MLENNENNGINQEPSKFGMPEGYFQKSANSIIQKIEWIEEHKAYPNLSNLKKESGFVVPEKYFNENESKLELIEFSKLISIDKTNVFKIPANYFESVDLSYLLNEENELQGFGKLNSLAKTNNFKVGENYFAVSEEKITAALLNDKKEAKVIKLFSPKLWYAAAAMLTITLGLWLYNHYYKIEELKDCGTLACVDKVDLVKAKNLENLDNDELYELVDTKKLEEKLEAKPEKNTESKTEAKTEKKDLDTSLKNVSEEDLLDEI
ncbi:MAG: hypothetical protein H0W73_16550 [Bacteroidetes bacterium]|nr:hypothetical protein [Bacteroidota bacterium]